MPSMTDGSLSEYSMNNNSGRGNHITPDVYYNQLTNDFVPAAKRVSSAGLHLLKSYEAMQAASDEYLRAMHGLVTSADSAMQPAKDQAKVLSGMLAEYGKAVVGHKKCVSSLKDMVEKINSHSASDKDRLKEEHSKFKKEERKLQKKKSGSQTELGEFYKSSSEKWSTNQEQRYKFFTEKHRQWFTTYIDLLGKFNVDKVRSPAVVLHTQGPVPDDWHEQQHHQAADESAAHKAIDSAFRSFENDARDRTLTESTVATAVDNIPSRRPTSEPIPGVMLVSNVKRESIVQVTTLPPVEEVPMYRHSASQMPYPDYPIVRASVVERESQVSMQQPTTPPGIGYAPMNAYQRETIPSQPTNQAPGVARAPHRMAGAVPIFGLTNDQRATSPVPQRYSVAREQPYNVVTSDQIRVGRVIDATPTTDEEMNRKMYHIDSVYDPMNSPSHQPAKPVIAKKPDDNVYVPPMFSSSQYGSILIVNDDFNATSGEQLTVNRGDKVYLLKSGTRGWVYVRDGRSGRTGWIPSPHVHP